MTTCNIAEAARLLKVHEETVAEMIRECKIPAAKVGRAVARLLRFCVHFCVHPHHPAYGYSASPIGATG